MRSMQRGWGHARPPPAPRGRRGPPSLLLSRGVPCAAASGNGNGSNSTSSSTFNTEDEDVWPQHGGAPGPPGRIPYSVPIVRPKRPSEMTFDEAAAACRMECEPERGLVYGATVRFFDSPALRLRRRALVMWDAGKPARVLIVKKPGEPGAAAKLKEIADWLEERGIQTLVEPPVAEAEFPQYAPFRAGSSQVDFVITLGGDGTVLYLASLFDGDEPLPPVMCFAMGTLGFLTPFDAADFRACLQRVLQANSTPLFCTLRTRKRCEVEDAHGRVHAVHHVLNEAVIDRGAFPGAVYVELFIDGAFVTAAEADGLIIATPSGSTAYSMSAGGSMVAPSVPCTLLTPLSPHSLSFRPLIIPESSELTIRVPTYARSHARASFDGKHPMRIPRGFSVHFSTSLCPLPLINMGSLDSDWYEGITQKLKWNQLLRGPHYGGPHAPKPGDRWQRGGVAAVGAGGEAPPPQQVLSVEERAAYQVVSASLQLQGDAEWFEASSSGAGAQSPSPGSDGGSSSSSGGNGGAGAAAQRAQQPQQTAPAQPVTPVASSSRAVSIDPYNAEHFTAEDRR